MTNDLVKPANPKMNSPLLSGILLTALGAIALAAPFFTTIVSTTWIAFILGSAGFAKLFYAFRTREEGGFIWKLLLSLLYLSVALSLLVNPVTGAITITLLIGSFFLTEGTFESILAFRLRPQKNWGWVLLNGIVTILLGAMIWFQWPGNAPWLLGTFVGVSILFTGISRIMLSFNPNLSNHSPVSASRSTDPSDNPASV
ncbi:MAG TPA: HdeD family acid-resistance protein [Leptolyngbyaceae cyanobacterium M33_DOE_097]|nr:HdeD family acid-resistance protein [Leptolyngbyaceae cyanobacterium M33_DOE_097]